MQAAMPFGDGGVSSRRNKMNGLEFYPLKLWESRIKSDLLILKVSFGRGRQAPWARRTPALKDEARGVTRKSRPRTEAKGSGR
jgi:hypothetical protein